jgi:hypothetical protein
MERMSGIRRLFDRITTAILEPTQTWFLQTVHEAHRRLNHSLHCAEMVRHHSSVVCGSLQACVPRP